MPDSNITKRALAQAMKELMAAHPFSKISVGDICEVCGMNRKSFYYHFRDKQDLVNWIFESEFVETLQVDEDTSGWSLLACMCRYFYRERVFYRRALSIEGQNSFRDYFIQAIHPFLQVFTQELFHEQDVTVSDFYITFLSDALLASIVRWLSEPTPMEPDTYLSLCRSLLVALAKSVFRGMPEEVEHDA